MEVARKALFPEGVHQNTMSNFKACTARKSPVTLALLEPLVTRAALKCSYNDDQLLNVGPDRQYIFKAWLVF